MKKLILENRKGQKIVGLLEKPEKEIKGTAVLQHGWGGTKEKPTMQAIKLGFHKVGFQTFNFDTTNSFGESDGEYEKSTLGLHSEDFEDVVMWVKEQCWFFGPLALSGHSKGGYSVVSFVESHPDEVQYLIPVAPVISGKLSFEAYEARSPGGLEKWKKEGYSTSPRKPGVKKHWFQMEERLNHDLLQKADKVTTPTLFIVGSEDESCPPDHVKKLCDILGAKDKELHLINNAPHSFYEIHEQEECTKIISEWLEKRVL